MKNELHFIDVQLLYLQCTTNIHVVYEFMEIFEIDSYEPQFQNYH